MNFIFTRKTLVFLWLTLISVMISAELSGVIIDNSGEPLFFTNIAIESEDIHLYADENGFFNIRGLETGSYELAFSMIGYSAKSLALSFAKDTFITVVLLPENVSSTKDMNKTPELEIFKRDITLSRRFLSTSDIEDSSPLKNDSPIYFLRNFPGTNTYDDFFASQPLVRGHSADKTAILLDGAPLYNPYHAFGMLSGVNIDYLSSVTSTTGASDIRRTGNLSGDFDMKVKNIRDDKPSVYFNFPLLYGNFTVLTPLYVHHSLDAVVSYTGSMPFLNIKNEEDTLKIVFDDFFGRVTFSPSAKTRVNANYYRSYDNFSVPQQQLKYKNDLFFVNGLNIINNDKIFRYNIGNSHFGFINYVSADIMTDTISTFFADMSLEMFSGDHDFELGTKIRTNDLAFLFFSFDESRAYTELTLYGADKYTVSDRLILDGGLSMTYVSDYNKFIISPGVSAKYFVDDKTAIQGGFGMDHQVMTSIWTDDFHYPFDFYIAPNEEISREYCVNMAIERYISDDYSLSAEVYSRYSQNITSYPFEGVISETYSNIGDSRAKGLELMFKKSRGRLRGLLSYSYLKSEEIFDDFLRTWRPGRFDRESSLNLIFSTNLGRFDFNTSINYGTGYPYGGDMSNRLPDVFSLNLAIHSNHKLFGANLRIFLEIMNLTNHENITWRNEFGEETKSLGILPMLGVRGEF